jgi:hypothetical protein
MNSQQSFHVRNRAEDTPQASLKHNPPYKATSASCLYKTHNTNTTKQHDKYLDFLIELNTRILQQYLPQQITIHKTTTFTFPNY